MTNGTHWNKKKSIHLFKNTDGLWSFLETDNPEKRWEAVMFVEYLNEPKEPLVDITWTDIRSAMPTRQAWCLVKRDVGDCQYGWTIRDSVWWDGKQFWADVPNHGTPLFVRDYTEELWGVSPGIVAWAYMATRRTVPGGGWQKFDKQTFL